MLRSSPDLALRVGVPPPDSPFVAARRLASYERVLCATPVFVKKHGPIKRIDSLSGIPCVILGNAPARWQFDTAEGVQSVAVEGRVRSNNVLALRDAALAGLGVVQLPRWLVVDPGPLRRSFVVPDA